MDNYPYPYRDLDESSIRLIRVLNTEPGSDEIECELVHRSIGTSPPPEYIAVSYTWGDPAGNRKIDVDGFKVSVPAALWEILSQIPSWVAMEPMLAARFPHANREQLKVFPVEYPWLLWADAVCINQQDVEEKSREIPKMTKIFRSAKEVVGWLGLNPLPGVDQTMLYHVFSRSRDLGKKGRANPEAWMNLSLAAPETLRTIMGVADMHAFTDTLFAVARLPWFKRLWIIQEHAVSQRSVALAIGLHVFDAQDLLMLLGLFTNRPEWFLQAVDLVCALTMERIREQARPWLEHDAEAPIEQAGSLDAFAQRLQALLAKASLAPFRATVKHDMIYGIISMAGPPDPLPAELAIDYSLPWEEVCRRYAKFIAERTASISFLARARQDPRWVGAVDREKIPSWVPDFSIMCTSVVYSPWYFVEKDRYQGSRVQFSEDGRAMTIDGIKLGPPVVLTRRTDLDERTEEVYTDPRVPFDRSEARGFVDGILSPAADLQGRPLEEVITCWITAWESSIDRPFRDSEVPQIRAAFMRWIGGTGPDVLQLDEALIAGESFSDRGRAVWRRLRTKTFIKNWIVTRDGRGWIALFNAEPLPEDQIVVLRGLPEYPAVLREVQGGGSFTLIGLVIERIPLASGPWEKTNKGILGSADYAWERVTLV